jgi:hypothetical protein
MSLFVFFISLLIVAQHVLGNHVPIIRSWQLRDVIALWWYVPWLQEGGQVRLVGSASMDGFVSQVTSSWFFLVTLNYDARSTTHQIYIPIVSLATLFVGHFSSFMHQKFWYPNTSLTHIYIHFYQSSAT